MGSMRMELWEAMKPVFDEKAVWTLVPGAGDAYAPLFEGTLSEAIVEAMKHAAYWKTTYTVLYSPQGRYKGDHISVAKVSIPPDSFLRAENQKPTA